VTSASRDRKFRQALTAAILCCAVLTVSMQCGPGEEQPGPAAATPETGDPAVSFVVGGYAIDAADEDKVTGTATPDGVLYAATASAYGYESDIVVRVTVLAPADQPVPADARIATMEVLASYETPGWADGISEARDGDERPWFQEQFTGMTLADLAVDPLDPAVGVEAVTGATITSEGATEAARKALQLIIEKTEEAYGAGEQ
jgi:hypothetical protein